MRTNDRLIAIYDFEFLPYALGDVLTWNVRTAMRCEELGKKLVDIYICLDERYPSCIYQRNMIDSDNFNMFFSELYGAFGTHPRLGNILIFRQREAMLEQLKKVTQIDGNSSQTIEDYYEILKNRNLDNFRYKFWNVAISAWNKPLVRSLINKVLPTKIKKGVFDVLKPQSEYYVNNVYSHAPLNQFYEEKKHIPLLQPSLGCLPDIEEIIARKFKGKIIVPYHLRLRRLDLGYGGNQSYARDSNFLEWYDFLKEANTKYPDVQFVALGRLQEKPLEILRLPNVTSLRLYGMGLGHELTLMLKSHLFIGSSSGFAALANFSNIPYFITRVNPGACEAYCIPQGASKLPFAGENQELVYEEETSEMLMRLLDKGLSQIENRVEQPAVSAALSQAIDLASWVKEQSNPLNRSSTTSRFYHDGNDRREETVYLLLPYLELARQALMENKLVEVGRILTMLKRHFPELCEQIPSYVLLSTCLASDIDDHSMDKLKQSMEKLNFAEVEAIVV